MRIEGPLGAWHDDAMLKIREIRKAQRVTQEVLAERIGTSQSNISEIEKGKHNPTLDTLTRIADALNVPVGDLFESEPAKDDAVRRFLAVYEELPTDARLKIIELAELMARQSGAPLSEH